MGVKFFLTTDLGRLKEENKVQTTLRILKDEHSEPQSHFEHLKHKKIEIPFFQKQ